MFLYPVLKQVRGISKTGRIKEPDQARGDFIGDIGKEVCWGGMLWDVLVRECFGVCFRGCFRGIGAFSPRMFGNAHVRLGDVSG